MRPAAPHRDNPLAVGAEDLDQVLRGLARGGGVELPRHPLELARGLEPLLEAQLLGARPDGVDRPVDGAQGSVPSGGVGGRWGILIAPVARRISSTVSSFCSLRP